MFVNHELKTIFFHIPKCAGTSVAKALGRESMMTTGHGTAQDFIRGNKLTVEMWEVYRTVCVVRNPWDRMVSSYKYHCHPSYKGGIKHVVEGMKSFEEYLAHFLPPTTLHRPCTDYFFIKESEIPMKYVLRFEMLQEDFSRFCGIIGYDGQLEHLNRSKVTEAKGYREYYTEETKKLIEAHYQSDIQCLKYGF